ncbi:hypothetical protein [Marinibacterium sp. SX1]|uniref:hypothetical protein n=1 Tax=Marinibacterium sp. SX1 TaxID=3388424 RepID=UPI003D16FFDA
MSDQAPIHRAPAKGTPDHDAPFHRTPRHGTPGRSDPGTLPEGSGLFHAAGLGAAGLAAGVILALAGLPWWVALAAYLVLPGALLALTALLARPASADTRPRPDQCTRGRSRAPWARPGRGVTRARPAPFSPRFGALHV